MLLVSIPRVAAAEEPFRITVIDRDTRRAVPMVSLTTTNEVQFLTDSGGVIAFDEPGLLGKRVFFHIESPGYIFATDGFGYAGLALNTQPGGEATLEVQRIDIAERLYRITGAGIYRDSVLLGDAVPLTDPLAAGRVMGQDTVVVTRYRDRYFWFWGDTERVAYPLGNFLAAGATSKPPELGGLEPERGIDLTYFVDDQGFAKRMCPFGEGHLVWLEWVASLPDEHGEKRLVARYSVIESLGVALAWGIAIFDEEKEIFVPHVQFDLDEGHRSAHPFRASQGGEEWMYVHPNLRVPPTLAGVSDPNRYEAFTPMAAPREEAPQERILLRDAHGAPRWDWRRGAPALHPSDLQRAITDGTLTEGEAVLRLRDVATGRPLLADRGSVAWNDYRGRWIWITSFLGEIWFAEADTPVGPWGYARRILHFEHYTFYNPAHHAFFDQDGGRRIYFEGTYTRTFSDSPVATPRYDYNQMMYALDLADPRLDLPVPVYRLAGTHELTLGDADHRPSSREDIATVSFFALPPHAEATGAIPIRAREGDDQALFRALPLESIETADLSGLWRLTSGGLEYRLTLRQSGERVQGGSASGALSDLVEGTFRDGRLDVRLTHDGKEYRLTGELGGSNLKGMWEGEGEQGDWTATRGGSSRSGFGTESLVELWRFRDPRTGRDTVTIEDDLAVRGWERSPDPLGRVWRTPHTVIAYDPVDR